MKHYEDKEEISDRKWNGEVCAHIGTGGGGDALNQKYVLSIVHRVIRMRAVAVPTMFCQTIEIELSINENFCC